jgi:hypothetical protein
VARVGGCSGDGRVCNFLSCPPRSTWSTVNRIKRLVRGAAAGSSTDAVQEMKIRGSGQLVGVEVER